jgi:hypothetical protein
VKATFQASSRAYILRLVLLLPVLSSLFALEEGRGLFLVEERLDRRPLDSRRELPPPERLELLPSFVLVFLSAFTSRLRDASRSASTSIFLMLPPKDSIAFRKVGITPTNVPFITRAVSEGGVGGASSNWISVPKKVIVEMMLRSPK